MKELRISSPNGGTLSYEYKSNDDLNTQYEELSRLDICKSCNRYIKVTSTCKECGCFMFLKTKIKKCKCPLDKW